MISFNDCSVFRRGRRDHNRDRNRDRSDERGGELDRARRRHEEEEEDYEKPRRPSGRQLIFCIFKLYENIHIFHMYFCNDIYTGSP